jgi:hypothetical protein
MTPRVSMAFGVVMVLLGVAIVVRTLSAGGGATAFGILLGVLFVAAGLGRVWLARSRA